MLLLTSFTIINFFARSAKPRTVVIFAFCPANVFKPDKMVMQTYVQVAVEHEDRHRYNRHHLRHLHRHQHDHHYHQHHQ